MNYIKCNVPMSLLLILCPIWLQAQSDNYFRYKHGRQVGLQPIHDRFMLVYDRAFEWSDSLQVSQQDGEQVFRFKMKDKLYELYESRSDRFTTNIKEAAPHVHVSPVF